MTATIEIDSSALCQESLTSISVAGGTWHLSRVSLPASNDRPLQLTVISLAEIPPLQAQAGEGVEALIARISRSYRYPEALVLCNNPDTALGPEHMAHAQGCGVLAIDTAQRELCWDAALGKGLPCYGIRDMLRLDCTRPNPQAALSALAFGLYFCHDGWPGVRITEDRQGISWASEDGCNLQARVLIRDGFEVACIEGPQGSWKDRGDEGTVRLHLSNGVHNIWTQPRFIMPRNPGPQA
ncbi:MAG: hypothetical protein EA401_07335 [Planctomycetota bacterium]|nr:MAG: hypothetical protein EA401_07335 [Planctomycetota bacterium]